MSNCKHTFRKGVCTQCGTPDPNSIFNPEVQKRLAKAGKTADKAVQNYLDALDNVLNGRKE